MRQKSVMDAVASSASVPTHQRTSPHSMWDLLRQHKTDHVQSTVPAHTHDNASPDPRIWKLGPLTLDPQAWHRFRHALGHHLSGHKASPYNEEAAKKITVHFAVRELLHTVEHPTLPVDPLFYEDITLHELAGEIDAKPSAHPSSFICLMCDSYASFPFFSELASAVSIGLFVSHKLSMTSRILCF